MDNLKLEKLLVFVLSVGNGAEIIFQLLVLVCKQECMIRPDAMSGTSFLVRCYSCLGLRERQLGKLRMRYKLLSDDLRVVATSINRLIYHSYSSDVTMP